MKFDKLSKVKNVARYCNKILFKIIIYKFKYLNLKPISGKIPIKRKTENMKNMKASRYGQPTCGKKFVYKHIGKRI